MDIKFLMMITCYSTLIGIGCGYLAWGSVGAIIGGCIGFFVGLTFNPDKDLSNLQDIF